MIWYACYNWFLMFELNFIINYPINNFSFLFELFYRQFYHLKTKYCIILNLILKLLVLFLKHWKQTNKINNYNKIIVFIYIVFWYNQCFIIIWDKISFLLIYKLKTKLGRNDWSNWVSCWTRRGLCTDGNSRY